MKIWLDDYRDPKTFGLVDLGRITHVQLVLNKHGRDNWTWVKTIDEAKPLLIAGDVEVLSCDNSLQDKFGLEGYMLLNWLEEQAYTNDVFPVPQYIYAHTDDSNKRDEMNACIASIYRAVSKRK